MELRERFSSRFYEAFRFISIGLTFNFWRLIPVGFARDPLEFFLCIFKFSVLRSVISYKMFLYLSDFVGLGLGLGLTTLLYCYIRLRRGEGISIGVNDFLCAGRTGL